MAEQTSTPAKAVIDDGAGITTAILHKELPGVAVVYIHGDQGQLRATAFKAQEIIDFDSVDTVIGTRASASFIEDAIEKYGAQLVNVGADAVQMATRAVIGVPGHVALDEATAAQTVAERLTPVAERTGATIHVADPYPTKPRPSRTPTPRPSPPTSIPSSRQARRPASSAAAP
jgi:hypothetical protein